ncbi:MAG: hypothetical protein GXO58_01575, partial [Thermodesulfobacteria bacterium]|nr:hypothetical protein [Thermodesulfobacteriota bacterium]
MPSPLVDRIKGKMAYPVTLFMLLFAVTGCAQYGNMDTGVNAPQVEKTETSKVARSTTKPQTIQEQPVLAVPPAPKRFKPAIRWKPAYSLTDVKIDEKGSTLPDMVVGANINTKNGKVPLNQVIKSLADLKGMNVAWSSDVNQDMPVAVNIKADANFWEALDDLLRQVDYFYEFKNNTILVKYKDTKRFHVTCPFLTGSYRTAVGGDFLGTSGDIDTGLQGELAVEHRDEDIDLWKTIEENLGRILNLATLNVPEVSTDTQDAASVQSICRTRFPNNPIQQSRCVQQEQARRQLQGQGANTQVASANRIVQGTGEGTRRGFYFTIDKPLGIVTVTAPRSILEKVEDYLDHLHEVLSKQVVIEAKIIEVDLDDSNSQGVDWTELLKDSPFNFQVTFGKSGQIYPTDGIKLLESVTMTREPFNLVLNFLDEYGNVKVLSNPKLSLLNGQPAMITGGKTTRYIDRVTTVVNDTGNGATTSYTIETRDILSGIGLGVIANIESDDEIVLQLTPVNSRLARITPRQFGSFLTGYAEVDLPEVNLREMTTMARVKSGHLLIIGGIIDDMEGVEGNKVPFLGDLPLVGWAFKSERKY